MTDADLPERVVVESPLQGDFERNLRYAALCCNDCLRRGEAPYASHLFFHRPGLLNDAVPEERERGIRCGFAWAAAAGKRAFYVDFGLSAGMVQGLREARRQGQRVEFRVLPPGLWDRMQEGERA